MPSLTITAAGTDGSEIVVYKEDLTPIHMDTEHASRQLIERLRWAVQDAQEIAARPAPPTGARATRPRRPR
jgi:hypothetical protein